MLELFDIVTPEPAASIVFTLPAIEDEKFDSISSDPIVTESFVSIGPFTLNDPVNWCTSPEESPNFVLPSENDVVI